MDLVMGMRLRAWVILVPAVALVTVAHAAQAGEVCRFEGTTSHAGRVIVRTEVTSAGGQTTVDVTLSLRATVWWVVGVEYLAEEISTWRQGELASVAVNNRTLSEGRVVRQQWDVFTQGAAGLEGWRVQAKSLAEFRRNHPGFVQHWDPASFGNAWLGDYAGAQPKRRPDLDLVRAATPSDAWSGVRTPLAMAFYWMRRLPPGGEVKRDARADLAVAPASSTGNAVQLWRTSLRHPALTGGTPSEAEAWVSPDRRLLQLTFTIHARQGAANGTVHALGCEGTASTSG
jgi:hypothetical protein